MRKPLLFLLVCLIPILNLVAQKDKQTLIDSLIERLNEIEDERESIIVFNELSNLYSRLNPELGIYYGKKAVHQSRALDWKGGEAKAWHYVGFNYYALWKLDSALICYRFAEPLFIDEELLKVQTRNYTGIGLVYEGMSQDSLSLAAYIKTLDGYRKIGNSKHIVVGLNNVANRYLGLRDHTKALDYYTRQAVLSDSIEYLNYKARAFRGISDTYYDLSDFPNSIENAYKSWKSTELKRLKPLVILIWLQEDCQFPTPPTQEIS